MTIVRLRASALTVLLAATLALTLAVERPARAQVQEALNFIVRAAPSAMEFMGYTSTGAAVFTQVVGTEGVVTYTVGGTAGAGKTAAAGGVAVSGGLAAAAAATGVLVGWGTVKSGLWDWANCDRGSAAWCDPIAPTVIEDGATFGDLGHVTGWSQENYFGVVRWRVHVVNDAVQSSQLNFYVAQDPANPSPDPDVSGQWTHYTDGQWNAGVAAGTERVIRLNTYPAADPKPTPAQMMLKLTDGSERAVGTGTGDSFAKDRRLRVDAECTNPLTQATTNVTEYSEWYAPGPAPPATPEVACPSGDVVTSTSTTREVDGQPENDEQLYELAPINMPDISQEPWVECTDGSCELMIHRVIDGQPHTCAADEVNCIGWYDAVQAGSSEYQCLWGTHVMPISDCDMFEKIDTDTYTGPDGGQKATPTAPGTSGNPMEVEDGCGGFSIFANPFSTLARGTACAMQWAFVPSEATMAKVDTVQESMATKPPMSYAGAVGEWFGAFGAIGQECWIIEHKNSFGTLDVMNSCDQSNGMVSWMTSNRGLLNIIVWLLFLTPFAWWAWATYAPGSQGDA